MDWVYVGTPKRMATGLDFEYFYLLLNAQVQGYSANSKFSKDHSIAIYVYIWGGLGW